MTTYTKLSDWLGTELPPLPGNQTLTTDQMVVVRGGLPYAYDPVTRFAYAEMSGNALATSITVMNDWESIAGLLDSLLDNGFILGSNIYTVTAETSLRPIWIEAGVTAKKVGAGDDTYEVGIFVNGVLTGVPMSLNTHNTKLDNAYLTVPTILATGDVVEIKIRNRDDVADVIITDMFFGIK